MKLFAELKGRRIVQIVLSYLGTGWVLLTVADQLVGQGVIPAFAYDLTLIWFIGGIPAALVVGWHHGEKGRQKAPLSEIAALVVILGGTAVVSGATLMDNLARRAAVAAAEASTMDLRDLAVLYFDDRTPGGGYRHLADGLTEDLIRELSEVKDLDVVTANGVAPFRRANVARDSVAGLLRVGTVVDGAVERVGDEVRVDLRVIEGQSGVEFQRTSFRHSADDVAGLREHITEESARLLREWLGEEVRVRRSKRATDDTNAWVLYQRGMSALRDAEEARRNGHDADVEPLFETADTILAQAELLDEAWPDPAVARADIAYQRSRMLHDRHERVAWIDRGLSHVERALAKEHEYPPALTWRGTLRYWKYLQRMIHDPEAAIALRSSARADLERAVDLDPSQAQAWSTLQHLYTKDESITDAVMAGRRAYEEDAYLEAAHDILWRLFTGNYDLAQFEQAARWCAEGQDRFPTSARFAACPLYLMASPGSRPDPDAAWDALARVDSLAEDHRSEYAHLQAMIFVSGALGHAGMADSAAAVLRRTHGQIGPHNDPHQSLLYHEAAMWAQLDSLDHAIDLLKRVKAGRPDETFAHHWWWQSVRSHPRYQELVAP